MSSAVNYEAKKKKSLHLATWKSLETRTVLVEYRGWKPKWEKVVKRYKFPIKR